MENNKGIQLRSYELAEVNKMSDMAKLLQKHIVNHRLFTNIAGKGYAHVDGWQFGGGLLGLFARVVAVENLSNEKEIKWRADAEIFNLKSGQVVSRGFAICSSLEGKKKGFDEYAILSMAQTRAIGKAYRNVIGWVMKLAGYESTPSEEIKNAEVKNAEQVDSTNASDVFRKKLEGVKDLDELKAVWATIPGQFKKELTGLKDALKKSIHENTKVQG